VPSSRLIVASNHEALPVKPRPAAFRASDANINANVPRTRDTDPALPTGIPAAARLLLWALIATVVAIGLWSWSGGGIVYDMLRLDWAAATKIERLQSYFAGWGVWGPLIYLAFVTVEVVVAPLPGLILYIPGGLIFGPVLGGALALFGNMAGAGLACALTRSFGADIERLVRNPSPRQREVQTSIERHGSWLIFWLRLNPLTSTDLISYAAGFTRIPLKQVVLATGLGVAPMCFAQSTLSDSVLTAFPQLIYPLVAVCIAYLVVAVILLRRMT
jgi:uncharacterized membrane protein YdjX (TVP38/TMEM64 family)